jgi:hypothetical protein
MKGVKIGKSDPQTYKIKKRQTEGKLEGAASQSQSLP